ncbi:MAG: rRNA maturation RNase YbeY [Dehalococcoidia bacterium]|nr:MAG: rRNA maturation RNase YbeY [Dehalococcoidia bacterium]
MGIYKYTVNIQVKRGLGFPFKKADVANVIERALELSRVDEPVEIDCLITDNSTIHKLNKLYRGIDSPTDVLSFRLSDKNPNIEDVDFPVDPNGIMNLGQIIISYPRTVEQAPQHGNTIKQELCLLLVHGTLHLLGFDHIDNSDARRMRRQENKITRYFDAAEEGNHGTTL